jgi:hypothetical protein
MQFANVVLAQIGWFAAVLGAACDAPLWGMACVLAVIVWHIAMSARPAPEAALVAWVCLIGFAAETIHVALGNVAYPSGLAVVLGAVAGPASFVSGVRLGGAHFIHTTPALVELVVSWAVLMPLLVWLSMRFDGVTMNAVDGAVVDTAGPESLHA